MRPAQDKRRACDPTAPESESTSHESWWSLLATLFKGVLWLGAGALALKLSPSLATIAHLALIAAYLRARHRRQALLGGSLPPLPSAAVPLTKIAPWLALAAPVLALAASLHAVLWVSLVPAMAAPVSPTWTSMQRPHGWLPSMLGAVVLAPLVEEWMFRGRLQPALIRKLGSAAGIVVTASAFAALHGTLVHLPVALMTGIVMGGAVHLTGRLLSAVVIHATRNTLPFIEIATGTLGGATTPFSARAIVAVALVLAVALAVLCYVGLRVWKLSREYSLHSSASLAPSPGD